MEEPQRVVEYLATRGKDRLIPGGLTFGNAHSIPTFYGRCYQCQYMSHSQKFCPLRYCPRCKEHGHADNACPQTRNFGSYFSFPAPDM